MPWYRAGTVSVTKDSNAVAGISTAFIANSRVGDAFIGPDGGQYEVTNIASDTALSIAPPYRGASTNPGAYALMPVQGYTKDLADQVRAMIQQWGSTLAGLGSVSTENIVPIAKGGTGATTQPAARSALGLGTAATLTAGSATGNVMVVDDLSSPETSTINVYGNSFKKWSASTAGAPEVSTQGTMLNLGYNSPTYGSQILMSFTGRMYFRSGTYSSAIMREVYHTGNTTRAQDGTLKAI